VICFRINPLKINPTSTLLSLPFSHSYDWNKFFKDEASWVNDVFSLTKVNEFHNFKTYSKKKKPPLANPINSFY
jgi:hypothetical protein